MTAVPILERLDAALEKARYRKLRTRRFYLDGADLEQLEREAPIVAATRFHGGVDIAGGSQSVLYCQNGVPIHVPKRLSAKGAP
jgi:hypothetical protein